MTQGQALLGGRCRWMQLLLSATIKVMASYRLYLLGLYLGHLFSSGGLFNWASHLRALTHSVGTKSHGNKSITEL